MSVDVSESVNKLLWERINIFPPKIKGEDQLQFIPFFPVIQLNLPNNTSDPLLEFKLSYHIPLSSTTITQIELIYLIPWIYNLALPAQSS